MLKCIKPKPKISYIDSKFCFLEEYGFKKKNEWVLNVINKYEYTHFDGSFIEILEDIREHYVNCIMNTRGTQVIFSYSYGNKINPTKNAFVSETFKRIDEIHTNHFSSTRPNQTKLLNSCIDQYSCLVKELISEYKKI